MKLTDYVIHIRVTLGVMYHRHFGIAGLISFSAVIASQLNYFTAEPPEVP